MLKNEILENISPGSLPNSMTVEKMTAGRRTPRNPIIMEVLRNYQYVDARGMGIIVKVIPVMRTFNHSEPVFEATEDYLKTVLNPSMNNLNVSVADKIISVISKNNYFTVQELADNLDLSKRTIERHLKRMQETNIIKRIGSKKGGHWSVNTLKESDEI